LLNYVIDLMEKNYEAVGFLPSPRIAAYFESDQVLIQRENGEPCGYLIFGGGCPVLKVYQCCIQVDARRREGGAALVNTLIERARKRGCCSIVLHCADDLESNGFWQAMGFHFAGTRDNGNRRGRLHNRWVLWIEGAIQPDLLLSAAG
jgi:ribosomal protein S18 acetylase RimI-like enzyme